MPVHIGGQPCNMDRIMAIAKKHNLKVIEDAARHTLPNTRGKNWEPLAIWVASAFRPARPLPAEKAEQ